MPDFPHIAVASARSPRFQAVLAEAWRLGRSLGAVRFGVIHVGECTPEAEAEFRSAMAGVGLPESAELHWRSGDPGETIVAFAEESGVDLLIAGALEREVGPHFLSGVARTLLRRSPCSLLLVTEPEIDAQAFRRIVALTDYSEASHRAFRVALDLAEREHAEILHVLSVYTPFTAARAQLGDAQGPARREDDEESLLEGFVQPAADSPVMVDARVIRSTTGFGASEFTKTIEADLLVVPAAADSGGGTLLPAYMDWVMQVIPCSLWVVKPKRPDSGSNTQGDA